MFKKSFFLLVLFLACENGNESKPEPQTNYQKLIAKKSTFLETDLVGVSVNYRGYMGILGSETPEQAQKMKVYASGIMLATESGGNVQASMAWYHMNMKTRVGEDTLGIYHIKKDDAANYNPKIWKEKSAPLNADGSIKVYGDEMAWMSLHADQDFTESLLKSPIEKVRVNQAVYTFKRADLKNAYFIRYDFTNIGNSELKNLHTGFYHDPDIYDSRANIGGFDLENEIAYYVGFNEQTKEYTLVGYTFLKAPKISLSTYGIDSSRELFRKHEAFEEPMNPESDRRDILNLLKGLSNSGTAMKNPVTNEDARYAYTGDVVAETGWRSEVRDIRGTIAAEPVNLAVNETKSMVVAYVQHKSTSLEGAINAMKAQVKNLRSDASLIE